MREIVDLDASEDEEEFTRRMGKAKGKGKNKEQAIATTGLNPPAASRMSINALVAPNPITAAVSAERPLPADRPPKPKGSRPGKAQRKALRRRAVEQEAAAAAAAAVGGGGVDEEEGMMNDV